MLRAERRHMMSTADKIPLHLVGRAFVGFEQALAAQVAAFEHEHPEITVVRTFREPQELYESTIAHAGLTGGEIDITLTLTDWLPEAIERQLLMPLDPLLHVNPP